MGRASGQLTETPRTREGTGRSATASVGSAIAQHLKRSPHRLRDSLTPVGGEVVDPRGNPHVDTAVADPRATPSASGLDPAGEVGVGDEGRAPAADEHIGIVLSAVVPERALVVLLDEGAEDEQHIVDIDAIAAVEVADIRIVARIAAPEGEVVGDYEGEGHPVGHSVLGCVYP
jgi:hypothetical protein